MIEFLASRMLVIVPLWMSLAVHEWAHAWAANRLGDDTARLLGRMSLDPTKHVDPVGTIALPLLGVPFGWARPVPINPLRFRGVHLATGVCLTAAAGPLSNVVFAAVAGVGFRGLDALGLLDVVPGIRWLLGTLVPLNLLLAVFNLLPVPPLDGSRIVEALLPRRWRAMWSAAGVGGPLVLIVGLVALETVLPWGPVTALFAWSTWLLGA